MTADVDQVAMAAVFSAITAAAVEGRRCPMNDELANIAGSSTAVWRAIADHGSTGGRR